MFRLRIGTISRAGVGGGLLLAAGLLAAAPLEAQVLSGELSGDLYGHAVAWAGDVDNDGRDDFLVGAPDNDGGGADAGRVYLYLGRYGVFPSSADLELDGEQGGDEFGFAVSTAGDVNGDGFDDFLVGAPGHDTAGTDAGRVYLFLGGNSPSSTPARFWDGDLPGGRFGAALAGGFDFNKDDHDDFATGAPDITDTDQGGGVSAGQVKIYLGAGTAAQIQQPSAFIFYGTLPNTLLGFSLRDAGDLNDDGYGDLVAGAPETTSPLRSGYAVVWFGRSSTFSAPDALVFDGELGADRFGWDVSGAGDVNGDSYDDLWIGAPRNDGGGSDAGAAYLYYGSSSMNTTYDWKVVGDTGGDRLGTAVDGGFDVSGDGTPDLVAGAPRADSPAENAGMVAVYFGGDPDPAGDLILLPDAPVPSFEAGDEFGSVVRFVGSFNGYGTTADARSEIVASAPEGNTTVSGTAGYVDFIVDTDTYVPVKVLLFEATAAAVGADVRWRLADDDGLAGVRVEAQRGVETVALHEGWLAAAEGAVADPEAAPQTVYHLLGRDRAGSVTLLAETALADGSRRLALAPPDRNPFRGSVSLAAALPPGPATVAVWDVRGRKVRTLFAGTSSGTNLPLFWDGRDDHGAPVPAGLYFVHARAGGEHATQKIVRLP